MNGCVGVLRSVGRSNQSGHTHQQARKHAASSPVVPLRAFARPPPSVGGVVGAGVPAADRADRLCTRPPPPTPTPHGPTASGKGKTARGANGSLLLAPCLVGASLSLACGWRSQGRSLSLMAAPPPTQFAWEPDDERRPGARDGDAASDGSPPPPTEARPHGTPPATARPDRSID